jgi:hypothetical protein
VDELRRSLKQYWLLYLGEGPSEVILKQGKQTVALLQSPTGYLHIWIFAYLHISSINQEPKGLKVDPTSLKTN